MGGGFSANGNEEPNRFSTSDCASTSTLLFSSLLDVCCLRGRTFNVTMALILKAGTDFK